MEDKVVIHCRKEDQNLVDKAIVEAVNQFKTKCNIQVQHTFGDSLTNWFYIC